MSEDWLQGKTILVTRPREQAVLLSRLLAEAGAQVVQLPAIAIEPLAEQEIERQKILDLDRYDKVISVSINAARFAHAWIDRYWPQLPAHIRWFAVGSASARELGRLGVEVDCPASDAGAQALLQLPALSSIAAERILVIKGEGGRELLQDELTERGASVDTLDLYRRRKAQYEDAWLQELLARPIDATVVTSLAILENTDALVTGFLPEFHALPLVTVSSRISAAARQLGFAWIVEANNATDTSILQALRKITPAAA